MATKMFVVESYKVKLGQAMTATWGGKKIKARGVISCHGGKGYRFIAYFLTGDSPVPSPVYKEDGKVAAVFFPFNEIPVFLDLLRNEKPIFAYMNSDRPDWNSLSTSQEPVGEEES
jgi:hypothetical protein